MSSPVKARKRCGSLGEHIVLFPNETSPLDVQCFSEIYVCDAFDLGIIVRLMQRNRTGFQMCMGDQT